MKVSKRLCFLTERNSWNSCNSFDFLTKRAWESVNHQRLQNMIKHGVIKLFVAIKKQRQRQRDKARLTSVMSTRSISFPLGTKALAKSLMAWIMLTSFRERDQDIFIRPPSHLHISPCGPNCESFFIRRV